MFRSAMIALTASLALSGAALAADDHMFPFDDIAWENVGLPGVDSALAWGSEEAGDAIWLIRIAPGTTIPRHVHTSDYWGMTVQGNWVHVHEDGSETPSASGDTAFVEGGVFHGDRCDSEVPCIALLDFDGPRDVAFPE